MTLPFRRRHHDIDTPHERARALGAIRMDEPLSDDEAAWLDGHLAGCRECAIALAGYAADRILLRAARDAHPEVPRDLWARTAAAIEQESAARGGRRARAPRQASAATAGHDAGRRDRRPGRLNLPLGAAAGLLVVLVVVGASLLPKGAPVGPTGSDTAGSIVPDATPIAVSASRLGWVRSSGAGEYSIYFAPVDHVCPTDDAVCTTVGNDTTPAALVLHDAPTAVVISPSAEQLVVVGAASSGGSVYVVPVPHATPTPTSSPSPVAPSGTPVAPSASPTTAVGSPTPSTGPTLEPTPAVTPAPTPTGAVSIADGVVVVGDVTYSADGSWLAFSARPADGSAGPDIYAWHAGDPHARQLTTDHRSVFSGWLGSTILASRVDAAPKDLGTALAAGLPTGSASPARAAAKPTTSPTATPTVSATPTAPAAGSPGATSSPPTPSATPELGATAFVIDPATGQATDLGLRAWRPAVDPTNQAVVYWEGGLVPTSDGLGWTLGSGRIVLDRWSPPAELNVPTPAPSPAPSSSGAAPTSEPGGSAVPTSEPGSTPVVLVEGAATDFDARFDPDGTRLAIWVADTADPAVGRLHLFVVHPESGSVDPKVVPLAGVPALRGFSIGTGRLAWVTPPGQDGEESTVQVLGWVNGTYGRAATNPGQRLQLIP